LKEEFNQSENLHLWKCKPHVLFNLFYDFVLNQVYRVVQINKAKSLESNG